MQFVRKRYLLIQKQEEEKERQRMSIVSSQGLCELD